MIRTHFTSRRERLRVHEPSKLMEWFILSSYKAFRVSRVNLEKKNYNLDSNRFVMSCVHAWFTIMQLSLLRS